MQSKGNPESKNTIVIEIKKDEFAYFCWNGQTRAKERRSPPDTQHNRVLQAPIMVSKQISKLYSGPMGPRSDNIQSVS